MNEPQKYYAQWKDLDSKDSIMYDSTDMKFPEKRKSTKKESRLVVNWGWGIGRGIDYKQPWVNFLGWWQCPKLELWWWLQNSINLFKVIELYTENRWTYANYTALKQLNNKDRHVNSWIDSFEEKIATFLSGTQEKRIYGKR